MGRPLRLLAGLALGAALAIATSAAAVAAQPTPPTIEDQSDQRKALYQSELERNLQPRTQADQAKPTQAAVELVRAGERNFVPDPDLISDVATPPPASPAPVPAPAGPRPGTGVVASLLLGLVGGVVGGCAALAGWAAATRRRLRQPASAT